MHGQGCMEWICVMEELQGLICNPVFGIVELLGLFMALAVWFWTLRYLPVTDEAEKKLQTHICILNKKLEEKHSVVSSKDFTVLRPYSFP